jgi:hypothetical protein
VSGDTYTLKTKSQHNKTGKRWKLANRRVDTKGIGISWHFVTMYASFSLIYDILVRKYKNVTIRLQKARIVTWIAVQYK